MIFCSDSLEFLRKQKDYSFDINYSDPPYALGSEVIIRPDGKVDYSKTSDFMDKWEMPTGEYWEQWFKEAYRTLKYGGYCIMFGMDRQLLLFKYYACLAGFTEKQSLYWYYISNFPKATDLGKMIDKNAGAEREVIGTQKVPNIKGDAFSLQNDKQKESYENIEHNITIPSTDLAKKYDGYKYSISPLKQTNETILVFQKPYKSGSCLHDTLAYENGDNTCCCGALDIDGNRVEISEVDNSSWSGSETWNEDSTFTKKGKCTSRIKPDGRYPAQTFINSETAEALDKQSGVLKQSTRTYNDNGEDTSWFATPQNKVVKGDIGGCSKILHKCDFEKDEHDLYFYNPKVSKSERNAGCDTFQEVNYAMGGGANGVIKKGLDKYDKSQTIGLQKIHKVRNNHPTLKPIKLNKNILSLFKTPNEQKIIYPFAGSGSEIIGGIKAGFTSYIGCEINQEYIDIALARIEYWSNFEGCELPETTEVAEGQMDIWDML